MRIIDIAAIEARWAELEMDHTNYADDIMAALREEFGDDALDVLDDMTPECATRTLRRAAGAAGFTAEERAELTWNDSVLLGWGDKRHVSHLSGEVL